MNILFLSRWFPIPPDNGSKIRIHALLKYLSLHHRIDLVSFTEEPLQEEQVKELQQYCRTIRVFRYRNSYHGESGDGFYTYFSPVPRAYLHAYNPEVQATLDEFVEKNTYDVLIASQIDMAMYAQKYKNIARIFEEVELTTIYQLVLRADTPLRRFRNQLTWWKYSNYVHRLLQTFDGRTVVSDLEERRTLSVAPDCKNIVVVPNGVEPAESGDDQHLEYDPERLIYTGAVTYLANMDAVRYFIERVLPVIRRRKPGIKLWVTGKTAGVDLGQLPHQENVLFTGYVEDIRPLIRSSLACIVPLRIGGGTRLKILEALSHGTPVISTSKGIEGLDLKRGRDVLVGDSPEEFAAEVFRLIEQPGLRQQLISHGREVVDRYGWEQIVQRYELYLDRVVSQKMNRG
jgi:glycosyltransferase involved in cell wall biosynthesis